MSWLPISGTLPQYSTNANGLAADYYLKFYASGTSTPVNMATDSTGATLLAKCALSDDGYPITNPLDDSTRFIPHIDQDYRIVLYLNETDADNNDTVSAAFNIDGMILQVVPTGNAANITLRNSNIETQDDYDRSPWFVDVDDFTAGVGPHVIAVPTDWNPTNPDMRFYRLDASGIVTPLTPTSTSSTTFTLIETLLSTDVIFIGDDEFRSTRIVPLATETLAGIVEKATAAELLAGTADKFPDALEILAGYGPPVYYFTNITGATLGGQFTSGSINISRLGRVVNITGKLNHTSVSGPFSAANALPAWAEPVELLVSQVSMGVSSYICESSITKSDLKLYLRYYDYSGVGYSNSSGIFNISYICVE